MVLDFRLEHGRSERDRGAVLLIDERLSHPAWEALFPETWRPERVSGPVEVAAALARDRLRF